MPFQSTAIKRVVIKLGTGVLTKGIGNLNTDCIQGICNQVAQLHKAGYEVMIVSSGAVGLGMGRLGLTEKPKQAATLQKCAAVGQSQLIETWQKSFAPSGKIVGQLLLTREDVVSRKRHLAAIALLEELLSSGIIPIINENDSISAAEIKFGDNDILSALVASMSKADALIILSTAPGLVDREGDGEIIPQVAKITPAIEQLAGGSESVTGTGGMITKIQAAHIATQSGCEVFIGSGANPQIIEQIFQGNAPGTFFNAATSDMHSRKRWIAFFQSPKGKVTVDSGAAEALRNKGSSLLPIGVTAVEGTFSPGDVITVVGEKGTRLAQGFSAYSREQLDKVLGLKAQTIHEQYPAQKTIEVIHRDSLVVFD